MSGKNIIFKKGKTGIFNEQNISTIGIDRRIFSFYLKDTKGNDIQIDYQIWDTAGQERFRSIIKNYYLSNQGILFLFDITKRDSFDSIENWIENITSSLGDKEDILLFILGNSPYSLKDLEQREVTEDKIDALCKEKDIYWCGEFCLRDMSVNELYDLFKLIVIKIYKKVGPYDKYKIITDNKNDKKNWTIDKNVKKIKYKFFYKIFNY